MSVPSPSPREGGRAPEPRPSILTLALDRDHEPVPLSDVAIARDAASAKRWGRVALFGSAAAWMILGVVGRGDQAAYSDLLGACLLSLVVAALVATVFRRAGPAHGYSPGRRMSQLSTGYLRGTGAAFCVLVFLGVAASWWPIPTCPDCGPVVGD